MRRELESPPQTERIHRRQYCQKSFLSLPGPGSNSHLIIITGFELMYISCYSLYGKGIEKGIGKELNQFPLLTERKVMAGD